MSHSQVVEWISGSFIQSHWPWPMLWASSMFSMLLAAASAPFRPPTGPASAGADHHPCGEVQTALNSDGALDVGPVLRAARILDIETDRLQIHRKCLDVRGAEMGVLGYVCDGHQCLTARRAKMRAGDLRGYRVGETFGEGVVVLRGNGFVVGAAVPGDSPLWTRSHRELFEKITEMPGCERSL